MNRRIWVLGAVALLLTGATAEAQGRRGGGRGRYAAPREGGYGRYDDGGRGGRGYDAGDRGRRYGGDDGYRRGQVLPPGARDAYVPDPGRYHLRAPPPGYGWVGDGRNAYLTQRSTGMVLDAVPGAYDPAPDDRRPRRGRGRRGPR